MNHESVYMYSRDTFTVTFLVSCKAYSGLTKMYSAYASSNVAESCSVALRLTVEICTVPLLSIHSAYD